MGRFKKFIDEKINLKSDYGEGITFIDIDETVFRTFAKIIVKDKKTGKEITQLDNQEFNSYKLKDNEEFDFYQFKNAKLFRETSIPIEKTIKRIKRMVKGIKNKGSNSRIIFLTARANFDNKFDVINTFKDHGINMDPNIFHIERSGNMKGTIPENKQKIILKYLKTGKYRRVRLVDDHKPNVKALIEIEKKYGNEINQAVRSYYNIPEDEEFPIVQYFGLWVKPDGSLQKL
jgi:hypothetical protein